MWESLVAVMLEAAAIISGIAYVLLNRRAGHRLRNARLAVVLLSELEVLRNSLRLIIDQCEEGKQAPYSGPIDIILPHKVYDGLLTSARIAYFGYSVQKQLQLVYVGIDILARKEPDIRDPNNTDSDPTQIQNEVADAIKSVMAFRARNRYRGRWFPVLKTIALEYDD